MPRTDKPRGPAGQCQPGCVQLLDDIQAAFPGVGSYGCYNPRRVRGGSSWSLHAEGRAIDVSVPWGLTHLGNRVFNWCIDNAEALGLQEILWYNQLWSARRPYVRYRYGHKDHVHIGLNWDGALKKTYYFTQNRKPVSAPPKPAPDWPGIVEHLKKIGKWPLEKEDEMKLRFLKLPNHPTLWLTDGLHRRPMKSMGEVDALVSAGIADEGVKEVHKDVLKRIKKV